jgi:3-oxoacyl-[acyl-carrier-protein] synthase-3
MAECTEANKPLRLSTVLQKDTVGMKKTYIKTMGHMTPKTVLDNQFFESLEIETDSEWISSRTGIERRLSVLDHETIKDLRFGRVTIPGLHESEKIPTLAEMGKEAWNHMESRDSSITKDSTDLVLCGTSVGDWEIPAAACAIAGEVGISGAAFDTNSACSSFVADLHVARGLMAIEAHKKAAVFNVERYTSRVDYSDRNSCILFGDGATVAYLEASDTPIEGSLEVVDTLMCSDTKGYHLVGIPMYQMFRQNGAAVQKFAVSKTVEVTRQILEKNNIDPAKVAYFMGHQANLRMLKSAVTKIGIEGPKHLFNVDVRGNQGGAGAPGVLSENWDKYKSGDLIVVAVVGSGLSWGATILRKV